MLEPCQKTKKARKHDSDSDTNCSWCTWNGLQRLAKKTDGIRDLRKN